MRIDRHQPFGLELLQRFAHWHPTDAQLLSDLIQIQSASSRSFSGQDGFPEHFDDSLFPADGNDLFRHDSELGPSPPLAPLPVAAAIQSRLNPTGSFDKNL